jgi:lipoprotein signal peptidase
MVLIIALVGLALDQLVKSLLMRDWPQLVSLNPGLAFGLDNRLLFLGFVLWIFVGRYLTDMKLRTSWYAIGLLGVSNLADRFGYGGVVDYLSLGSLHFNLADLLICAIISWLIYRVSFRSKPHKSPLLDKTTSLL